MSYIRGKAYAKINLFLDIIERRTDGYHEIKTVFQTVSLADELHFKESFSEISLSCNCKDLPCNESNLIYKAIELVKQEYSINKGIEVYLSKNIPLFAGLGGGSSNAATTIKSLNKLWKLNMSQEDMLEIAKRIGSDVPFFIRGGTVLAEGRGEKLVSLLPTPDLWVIILKPDVSISTAMAYSQWKRDFCQKKPDFHDFLKNLKKGDLLNKGLLYNSFEYILEDKYPVIKEIKKILEREGIKDSLLSGSGSSVFGLTKSRDLAEKVKDIFKNKKGFGCFITKTIEG